jgi:hypothetical protein
MRTAARCCILLMLAACRGEDRGGLHTAVSTASQECGYTASSWPGRPTSAIGAGQLVQLGGGLPQGLNPRVFLEEHLHEFGAVYRARPFQNTCGVLLHHAFALWAMVRTLQPSVVIESGVNTGLSTYFIRSAAPDATIICIDPKDFPICDKTHHRWKPTSKVYYLTGTHFADFEKVDWAAKVAEFGLPPDWASTALAFFDDHMSSYHRLPVCQKLGIRDIIFEDNYLPGFGDLRVRTSEDKKLWEGDIVGNSKLGFGMKQLFDRGLSDSDAARAVKIVESYAEFPPLLFWVPSTMRAGVAFGHRLGTKKVYTDEVLLGPSSNKTLYPEPVLRPDVCSGHLDLLKQVVQAIGVGPKICTSKAPGALEACRFHDSESWNAALQKQPSIRAAKDEWSLYNFICYLRLRPAAVA